MKHFRIICIFCCLQFFTPTVRSQNFDIDLLKSINPHYPVGGFWKITSGSYIVVAGVASLGTLAYSLIENDKDLRYKSYEILAAFGITTIVTQGLKSICARPRPYETYPDEIFILSPSQGYSFPSGHTSIAFTTATSLTLIFKKWYIAVPAYLWAGCVGYSRMYLGKHYPSDVLAGAAVGAGSSLLSHWMSKKFFEQKQVSTHPSNAL